MAFSNKSANISRSRSENHIAKTCTAERITVYLTNLVTILHGTNISEQGGKQANYSFHTCTVTVLSYWHRLIITCLPGSLPVVYFIYQKCSTSKLLKYCGHLQVCSCTVHCLEFTRKSDNIETILLPRLEPAHANRTRDL